MLTHLRNRVHAIVEGVVAAGRQQRRDLADRRAHIAPALACPQLRVRPQARHVVHAGVGDLRFVQPRLHLLGGHAGEALHDEGPELVAVRTAPGIGVEARVGGELRVLQHLVAEDLPLALVLQAQHHRATVAHGERAVGVDGGVAGAGARRRRGALEGVVHGKAHPFAQRFEHGHVDVAALARLAAQQQRRQDAGVGVHAGGDVGDGAAGLAGCLGRAGDRQETGLALDQQVVRLLVAVGAVVAVAGDVADDQLRVPGVQRFERQAHARGGAGRQVLQQHIGAGQQIHQRGQGVGILQVEREAFLAAVGPHEVRGLTVHAGVVGTREVAHARPLHLDDTRAQVGQLAAGKGRGDGVLERDDGDAVKRPDVFAHIHPFRRPRSRPCQRTPCSGLYRALALSSLAQQEGGRRRRRLRGVFIQKDRGSPRMCSAT